MAHEVWEGCSSPVSAVLVVGDRLRKAEWEENEEEMESLGGRGSRS